MRHFILSEEITTPGLLRKHASLFLQKKSAFCSEEIMKLLNFFFKHKKVLGLQRKQANLPHNFFRKNKLFFSRNNEMLAIVLKEKIIPG
jgi:hypothetical protein